MDERSLTGIEFSHEKSPRFDGHFYRAILTTGIFCRPICPSRPARAENVLFFTTAAAAAAAEAGFRPCLRCRPESAPGRPEGMGVSQSVRQALRLIAEGVEGDELANRLHLSTRQLRRRFVKELGTPPVAVIQTRRLLFAKKLLDETQLAMSDVAFAAGYSSVRRFNAAIRQTYDRTPSEIRNSRRNARITKSPDIIRLKLFYRPPYHWPYALRFLAQHSAAGVEVVTDTCYRRIVRFADEIGVIEATPVPAENHLLLKVPRHLSKHLLLITERFKQLFDLRTDPAFIAERLQDDPLLSTLLVRYPGIRNLGVWDRFEAAVRIIVAQQVSVQVASLFMKRLTTHFGSSIEPCYDESFTHLFPTPAQLAAADLAAIGLTKRKAATIQAVARAVMNDELNWDSAETLPVRIATLTTMKGIGNWSANLIAMRVLNEGDAFPSGDLQLRKAVALDGAPPSEAQALRQRAEQWRPWRAYAAQLLWAAQQTNQNTVV